MLLLSASALLSGCYKHTHLVQQTHPPDVVMNATAEELVGKLNENFTAINTLNASVTITASTGGGKAGKVTEYTSFKGYVLMRKPSDLRVILQVPIIGSVGLDMVSDGHNFKLIIPSRNKALVGADEVRTPSKNALENLRPGIFFDSFLIRGANQEEAVALTESERILAPSSPKHDAIEDPDYDLAILRKKPATDATAGSPEMLETTRVVHFTRVTLLPYRQDIYDARGRVVTTVLYSDYQQYGNISFPTQIDIKRPYDEYELKIAITKLTPNKPLENDQFDLQIPAGMTIKHMD